jgi:hypothetical protein
MLHQYEYQLMACLQKEESAMQSKFHLTMDGIDVPIAVSRHHDTDSLTFDCYFPLTRVDGALSSDRETLHFLLRANQILGMRRCGVIYIDDQNKIWPHTYFNTAKYKPLSEAIEKINSAHTFAMQLISSHSATLPQ